MTRVDDVTTTSKFGGFRLLPGLTTLNQTHTTNPRSLLREAGCAFRADALSIRMHMAPIAMLVLESIRHEIFALWNGKKRSESEPAS